ncbi:MAG: hypothetical protein K8S23_11045 [Candidatus Cloacimonetes bacterium]|nr:hypothetical protein [Candidatus Cloacimonadota bacterium]
MQKNNFLQIFLLVIIIVGFFWGIYQLFSYRFQKGDVFPEYSTLRSDEQGCKAYYETLKLLEKVEVEKNFIPINQLREYHNTTFIFAGLTYNQIQSFDYYKEQTFQNILKNNNIMVLLLNPEIYFTFIDSLSAIIDSTINKNEDKYKFSENLGFEILSSKIDSLSRNSAKQNSESKEHNREIEKTAFIPGIESGDDNLPKKIKWESKLYLKVNEDWKIKYKNMDNPVICELKKDDYSVIIATDSYFLKNTTLRDERETEFLLWLTGSNTKIIIDESHFGMANKHGVSYLLKKYRLFYSVLVLIVLALLFIWKNMYSFLPKTSKFSDNEEKQVIFVESGTVELLRQNLTPQQLLPICLDEWKKSLKIHKKNDRGRLEEIENIATQEKLNKNGIINSYIKISKILNRRKNGRTFTNAHRINSKSKK